MGTPADPIEFTRRNADGSLQRVGNEITSIAPDGNASEFSMATVGAHITNSNLAAVTTFTKPAGATALLAQNTGTKGIRFTLDGTDPTASVGFQLPTGQMPVLIPCPGTAIEMIREDNGAALDAQWVK